MIFKYFLLTIFCINLPSSNPINNSKIIEKGISSPKTAVKAFTKSTMAHVRGFSFFKKPKVKPRRFRKKTQDIVKENINDYFINTTLHGLKYVGMSKLSFIERYKSLVT